MVPLQVDPRAFHILSHWNHNYTMETVLVELRKEMSESCCADVLDACAASLDCLPGGAAPSPSAGFEQRRRGVGVMLCR